MEPRTNRCCRDLPTVPTTLANVPPRRSRRLLSCCRARAGASERMPPWSILRKSVRDLARKRSSTLMTQEHLVRFQVSPSESRMLQPSEFDHVICICVASNRAHRDLPARCFPLSGAHSATGTSRSHRRQTHIRRHSVVVHSSRRDLSAAMMRALQQVAQVGSRSRHLIEPTSSMMHACVAAADKTQQRVACNCPGCEPMAQIY